MKYLESFSEKRIFDYNFVFELTKTRSLADETIQNYLKKEYIERVKKNLYVTMSLETGGVIPSKFEIGSNITNNSCISLHSAFEYYGFSNQVYNEVSVSSLTKFKDFNFENNRYHYVYSTSNRFIEDVNGVKVSTIAKTIVDTIDSIKSYDDMEELIYNLSSLPAINGLDVIEYLLFVNKKVLFNKVGLILSYFNDGLLITDKLLNQMEKSGTKSVKYFSKEKHRLKKYYKEWNLYCYDLEKIIKEDSNV